MRQLKWFASSWASTHAASCAAVVADVLPYDAHSQRNRRVAKVSRKYAYLDPGDLVNIEYPQSVSTLKRITSVKDSGTLVELDLVDTEVTLFALVGYGGSQAASQSALVQAAITRLELLDIASLRDADNNAGLYCAMSGYNVNSSGVAAVIALAQAALQEAEQKTKAAEQSCKRGA